MLSDEERKAIERFKNLIYTYQDVIEDEYSDYEEKESAKEYKEVSEKILNLIEKQSKEIEELKEKYSKKLIEFQKEREWYEKNSTSNDKIKAKIEELDDLNSPFAQRVIKGKEVYLTEMVQNILQSLLEKE